MSVAAGVLEAADKPASHLLRPEKKSARETPLERYSHRLRGWLTLPGDWRVARYRRLARRVIDLGNELAQIETTGLSERADTLRQHLRQNGYDETRLVEAFALVREAAGRTLGMYHFESQLIGGLVMFDGSIAEMATGEGKTLVATLPACAAALAGIPAHVVTVNDYLTERDAELMRPVYELLGISIASVINDMEPPERRVAYAHEVTYCTNKELVFDYLKDLLVLDKRDSYLRMAAEHLGGASGPGRELLLRGLHFAIVDEADSILVDEARTPLIISATGPDHEEQEQVLAEAMDMVGHLEEGRDYTIDHERRRAKITDEGYLRIKELGEPLGGFWLGRIRREEVVQQALYATFLLTREVHYLVRDDKVQIIDELTGRIMEDRSWEKGLHQMVELKEAVPLTAPRETLARISYQRFFRKYFHLAGMTGTAEEIRGELWRTYGLNVVPVPLNRPSLRRTLAPTVSHDENRKWSAVCARVVALRDAGRAILVGTQSVGASEALSIALEERGIPHRVLNAKQDAEEAAIVAEAGQPGRVTVATSMAGRGTDIKLAEAVRAAGGLHVILTELHEASRIDRQLRGRCARQGDPGSYEVMVSFEDFLVRGPRGGWRVRLAASRLIRMLGLGDRIGLWAITSAQRRLERAYAKIRGELFNHDQKQADLLAFAGKDTG